MQSRKDFLRKQIDDTLKALVKWNPELGRLMALKALQDYDNTLTRLTSTYMNQMRSNQIIEASGFAVEFASAIEAGLNEAWRLGMRENEATEMLEEWQAELDGIIAEEQSHIPDLAAYLTEVAGNAESMGDAINTARARVSMWVTRYEEVRNLAILRSADEKTKLIWIYGDTEHCNTCAELNGLVAYAREWDEAELRPQNPPNALLECGGWKCQCTLQPTDERHTRNVLERLMRLRSVGIAR